VIFRPIPDPSTKLSGLRAGALEIVDEVPPREQATLRGAPEVELGEMQATRWPMLRLNLAKSPLDNTAVRQALSMAVDREAIVRAIFFGNASPAYGPIAPIYKAVYDPSVAEYGFKRDVEKAKQKLAEGGQANGFSLTLDIGPTPEQTRMAELLKANWAEIGVTAEISTFETNVLTDRLRNGSFQVALGSWTPRPDVDGTVYRHFRTGSAFNYLSYSNPRVDELLDTTRRLPPGDERTKAFRDVQRLIVEDAPWIFLVFENQAFGIAKHVEGLPLVPDTMLRPKTAWLNK
jgi:peptide/nickel transport system substrate-binding protein